MFLYGTLVWLIEHGWLMFLHLSARTSFPKPLQPAYMRYACEIALYLSSVFESHVPEKKEETL